MAVTSNRTTKIAMSGDLTFLYESVIANAAAPGDSDIQNLAAGANTIVIPVSGATVKACTIVPPAGNTSVLTLKGVAGDTGILISLTEPTTIAFPAVPPASFVINSVSTVTSIRFIWS